MQAGLAGASAAGDLAGAAGPDGAVADESSYGDTSAVLYVLSADCGAPYGRRTFACGPGMGGAVVSYACPRAAPEPTCLYYDKPKKAWTASGCTVARVDATSILCACDALRDFGTRFAALDNAPANVFVTAAPAVATATAPASTMLLVPGS